MKNIFAIVILALVSCTSSSTAPVGTSVTTVSSSSGSESVSTCAADDVIDGGTGGHTSDGGTVVDAGK